LAFIFWYAGIKRCTACTAAAFSGMMPFTSLILSVLVLGEYANWQQWAGGGLVILGMILIGWQKNAPAPAIISAKAKA
jgi:drug/metabolite transporter (DMT)-like permease